MEEICALFCPMMACGAVFGEIVFQIMFSRHPIYQKMSFSDYVYDPVKFHVYWSRTSLADVGVDKSVSCGAVRHFWSMCLVMTHLCERHAHFCTSLTVHRKGSQLFLHCASKEVSRGITFDMNWSIEWGLIRWGIFGIRWFCAEVIISSQSSLVFGILQEGGAAVDVEDHSTFVISCYGLIMRGVIM